MRDLFIRMRHVALAAAVERVTRIRNGDEFIFCIDSQGRSGLETPGCRLK